MQVRVKISILIRKYRVVQFDHRLRDKPIRCFKICPETVDFPLSEHHIDVLSEQEGQVGQEASNIVQFVSDQYIHYASQNIVFFHSWLLATLSLTLQFDAFSNLLQQTTSKG